MFVFEFLRVLRRSVVAKKITWDFPPIGGTRKATQKPWFVAMCHFVCLTNYIY